MAGVPETGLRKYSIPNSAIPRAICSSKPMRRAQGFTTGIRDHLWHVLHVYQNLNDRPGFALAAAIEKVRDK